MQGRYPSPGYGERLTRRHFLAAGAGALAAGLGAVVLARPSFSSGVPIDPDQAWARAREQMVAELRALGLAGERVLAALGMVPRHHFVTVDYLAAAYEDAPLPLEADGSVAQPYHVAYDLQIRQTISRPWVVARMTELAAVAPGARVLEIGSGSGYQAAVLEALGARVTTLEINPRLAQRARTRLAGSSVQALEADGAAGWPAGGPYDAILMTAAAPRPPGELVVQLRPGGRLVAPVGHANEFQRLLAVERGSGAAQWQDHGPILAIPLVVQDATA